MNIIGRKNMMEMLTIYVDDKDIKKDVVNWALKIISTHHILSIEDFWKDDINKILISVKKDSYNSYLKLRKIIARIYKDKMNQLSQDSNFYSNEKIGKEVVNQGLKEIDYDSWYYWYLLNFDSEEDAIEWIETNNQNEDIYIKYDGTNSPYDCSGLTFSDNMCIRKVGKNRILATKRYAIDC